MEKLSLTIDVTKIPKDKIVERRYFDKQNHEIVAKDLKLEVVPLREPKKIREGDTWEMWKTHFVAMQQTKEERENKIKSTIIGDAIMFKQKAKVEEPNEEEIGEEINPADIPF